VWKPVPLPAVSIVLLNASVLYLFCVIRGKANGVMGDKESPVKGRTLLAFVSTACSATQLNCQMHLKFCLVYLFHFTALTDRTILLCNFDEN
jgi:hypothetical protein